MSPDTEDLALADVSGVKRNINVGLLDRGNLAPGDWVLIHVGFALSKVDEAEAKASLEFLETLGKAYTDEIKAMEDAMALEAAPPGAPGDPPAGF